MGAAFPVDPSQLSNEWLGDAVGGKVSSFDVEQIGIGVGLLGRLFRVSLQGDGVPASVIAKFPTLDEGARMNVVEPLRFYEKEVRFYSEAANEAPISTPKVYFAEHDPGSGDFALLLEDLSDQLMCDRTWDHQEARSHRRMVASLRLWESGSFRKVLGYRVSDVPIASAGRDVQQAAAALESSYPLKGAYGIRRRFPRLIE